MADQLRKGRVKYGGSHSSKTFANLREEQETYLGGQRKYGTLPLLATLCSHSSKTFANHEEEIGRALLEVLHVSSHSSKTFANGSLFHE